MKKNQRVLLDIDILRKEISDYRILLEKINTPSNIMKIMLENNYKIYNYALEEKEATITFVENSLNDSARVNLIFDDGFECSASKKSLIWKK
jgi:hypothetical protein